ncbi:MAG TPA: heme o synthase [Candidatus Micrarchaeaceae archaeon]|nr:heme o synthase [Candidatus Micrarchaeaceae archaeon]
METVSAGTSGAPLNASVGVWTGPRALASRRVIKQVVSDYLSLTKPGVMSLLLVTEFLAMVIAARGWPGLGLSMAAVAGGACASGGAAAINCWFDRDIDAVMGRTRHRPVPAGRIRPGSALAFGVGLSLAGFLVFLTLVNPLAAVLSAAGGAFYVFIYTVWLKRATKSNIVIGGAAGAIPPLVGWAAVTHGIGPVGLALFAVVFLWTPPHFWALSLIVRRDYAAVAVPMRPVVVGVKRTRSSIVGYTVLLVAFSCSLAIWLGPAELAVALLLGAPFVGLSVMVLREASGMRWARQLFRFSMIYLFVFFLGTAGVAVFAR